MVDVISEVDVISLSEVDVISEVDVMSVVGIKSVVTVGVTSVAVVMSVAVVGVVSVAVVGVVSVTVVGVVSVAGVVIATSFPLFIKTIGIVIPQDKSIITKRTAIPRSCFLFSPHHILPLVAFFNSFDRLGVASERKVSFKEKFGRKTFLLATFPPFSKSMEFSEK